MTENKKKINLTNVVLIYGKDPYPLSLNRDTNPLMHIFTKMLTDQDHF
jgi:hypothetical protein